MIEAIGLTFAAWAASVLSFAAAGQAIGLQLTIGEAAFMAAGVALATAIPSGPGYLGTFELAAKTIAATFAIGPDPALAMAVLVHVGQLLVTSGGGAVALARIGWARTPAAEGAPTATTPTTTSAPAAPVSATRTPD
jgi:uncharacterized membrane protein YbhN (UPF0104 family)